MIILDFRLALLGNQISLYVLKEESYPAWNHGFSFTELTALITKLEFVYAVKLVFIRALLLQKV
jgi:hypothetical protein